MRRYSTRRSAFFWNSLIPLGAILVIGIIWSLTIDLIRHERDNPLRGNPSTNLNEDSDFGGLRGYVIDVAVLETLIIALAASGLMLHTLRQNRSLQAQAGVREQQLQTQAILDNIPDIAWLKDTELRFLAVNVALATACGKSPTEMVGKTDFDFFPYELARKYRQNDIEVMKSGSHKSVEETLMLRDGTLRTVETIKTRVCDAENRVVGTVGIARDITSRLQVDEHLRLSAKAFESIADGVIITDAQRKIISVNRAFERITGYTPDEIIGKHPTFLRSERHDAEFYSEMWRKVGEEGSWSGEVWSVRKNGEVFPEILGISEVRDDTGEVKHYVSACTDISYLKEYEAKLNFQAQHDVLTGLPNRVCFQERFRDALKRARRDGVQVAVLFLDIDRFKNVNDSMGHEAGDLLLQTVARRLSENLREVDVLARFGGDEFAVLLDAIHDNQEAAIVGEKLLGSIVKPITLQGRELYVTVSIGISCFPQDGLDIDGLFKNADTAMYRVKEEGRNSYQFYSPEMNLRAMEFLSLSSGLRSALDHKELYLEYQPCFDLPTGKVTRAEALVRWKSAELGLVPPNRFIPIAEETGLIEPIGEFVMRSACLQMREWIDAGFEVERIAVNLSARQFEHPDLVDRIARTLKDAHLPGKYLEFDVTESMVMHDPQKAVEILHELKAMGMTIAIDDFGTGYSSLGCLHRFPVDFLKIDKSFVDGVPSNPDHRSIVRAITALARSLNLKLIAEGVETPAQRAFLEEQGCDEVQGHLFGKPAEARNLTELLRSQIPSQLSR